MAEARRTHIRDEVLDERLNGYGKRLYTGSAFTLKAVGRTLNVTRWKQRRTTYLIATVE